LIFVRRKKRLFASIFLPAVRRLQAISRSGPAACDAITRANHGIPRRPMAGSDSD
jgi:hypothetical protein